MNFPAFENNFLSEIILKIQFQNISEEDYYSNFKEFKNLMNKEFPLLTEYKSKEFKFTSINNEEPTVTSKLGLKRWVFRDNNKKLLTLNHDEIILQYNGEFYHSFENDIAPILELILNGLAIFNVENFNEIGMRYINQIKNVSLNLNEILAEDYHFNFNIKNNIRIMNKVEFNEDDFLIIFNFGDFNDNYPSTIIKNNYILDYDCIFNQPITHNHLENKINSMHDKIKYYFDKTTSNMFKEKLGDVDGFIKQYN